MSVLATSTLVTGTREVMAEAARVGKDSKKREGEYLENLVRVLCIWYPITFWKKSVPMSVLLDSGSEVNAIHPTFTQEIELPIRPTDVEAQKNDGTILDTFRIVVIAFSVTDKANRVRFFEETFLVANISPKVVLGMSYLTLNDADVNFLGQELWWRTYTTEEALPTTKRIELVDKKKFVAAAFDLKYETYVIHIG